MIFIIDYKNLNQKIVRKLYPLPRIDDTIQKLKGFQYAMELYLNIGYYTIDLFPESHDLTTIVTEFGKFRYNIVLTVLCASSDIFQAKVDKLIGDIEGVKKYINNILVLGKGGFYQHIDQIRVIFARICAIGLKANAPKCIVGLKEIPFLGYIITQE